MNAAIDNETGATLDAPAHVTIPDFTAVDGVSAVAAPIVQELDAEYFDTGDLSLLAADIGLRRRRVGDDAGWDVEIRHTKSQRVTIHRPLAGTRGQPPKELRDLVIARARRAPLAPVARVRTHRTLYRLLDQRGRTLAEVADDAVTADAPSQPPMTWRELEVEVADGDGDLLAAVERVLRDQGATPSDEPSRLARVLAERLATTRPVSPGDATTAGDVVARYLREQITALVDLDPAVRIDLEDAVHKMRVATRRLRSALATYRRLLDTERTEPIRAELKWLGGVLGSVRDAEVIREHLRASVDAQPPRLVIGPVTERIVTTLDARHSAAHRRALRELSSNRYVRLLGALDHLPDAVGGERADKPARKVLTREIRRSHRRMRRHLVAAQEPSGGHADERLHEVRKAAKRVRYAAESARDVLGDKADALAARMEEAQETLGTHQDTVVIRDVLRSLAADADRQDEPSFTYGRLHACEERRGDDARASFLARVDDGWADPPRWLA